MHEHVLLKLLRSKHHLECLEREIAEWFNGNHHTVATEKDLRRPYQFITWVEADPLPLDPFGALVGDILQAMRASLDHLAFALALKFTDPLPPDMAEDSEFPIFGDINKRGQSGVGRDLFRDNGRRKILGVDPAVATIIEGFQPYHRGADFEGDPLWRLHELSRFEKHRAIHPVVCAFGGAYMDPRKLVNANLGLPKGKAKIVSHGGPIEGKTKVVEFAAHPVNPRMPMHVHFEPALGIAFAQASAAPGEDVLKSLSELHNYVAATVFPALIPYL